MIVAGEFSALVALRAKEGEFTALREWDRAEQLQLVQPLLVLDPDSSPPKQFDKVEEVARNLHRHGRHLMIDASEVAHLPDFGGGPVGALGELADRLDGPADLFDDYPVPFEPVIRSDASIEDFSAYRNLCEELGLGGGLRIRSVEALGERLDALLEQLRLDSADLDLILDLQYLPEITPRITDRAANALRTIAEAGPFRSMTLLSGSVPRLLERTSTWEQPRVEELLWRLLGEEISVGLRLGDYGVVHPKPGRGFWSKHVNLKYSCSGSWLYSRERMRERAEEIEVESARASTLRAICRDLVDSDYFSGSEFSWGDEEISTALHDRAPKWGRASRPVALGTSHHLAYLATRACGLNAHSGADQR